jgi:hypothetical protein
MRFPHSILLALCIAVLPAGMVWGQGGGGGAAGSGTAAPTNSAVAPGAPPVMGFGQSTTVPPEVRGAAEFPPDTTTGLATTAADGVSTKIVPARPCSTAARETDGTTTCIGIPSRRN